MVRMHGLVILSAMLSAPAIAQDADQSVIAEENTLVAEQEAEAGEQVRQKRPALILDLPLPEIANDDPNQRKIEFGAWPAPDADTAKQTVAALCKSIGYSNGAVSRTESRSGDRVVYITQVICID